MKDCVYILIWIVALVFFILTMAYLVAYYVRKGWEDAKNEKTTGLGCVRRDVESSG